MKNSGKSNTNLEKVIFREQLVTIGDLEDFKTDLLLSLQNFLSQRNSPVGKKWLKTYEVRKLLGVSAGTLQTLRNNGTIPFSRIGGILYYNTDDIDRVVEQMKHNKWKEISNDK